jgi:hypothetical protein
MAIPAAYFRHHLCQSAEGGSLYSIIPLSLYPTTLKHQNSFMGLRTDINPCSTFNNEKRTPELFLQGFKPEFKIHPVFYIGIHQNGLYDGCAREQGDGEIFVFPPAPLLTSNW